MIVSFKYGDNYVTVDVSNIYIHDGSIDEPPWLDYDIDNIECDEDVTEEEIEPYISEQIRSRRCTRR